MNLVGFNHGAEVKQSSYSGHILHKRIKQSDWHREFCDQNWETALNNWLYFYECLRICRKAVSYLIHSRCTWLHTHKWTESYRRIYVYLSIYNHINQIHT